MIRRDFMGTSDGSKVFSDVLKCSKWAYGCLWSPMGLLENTKGVPGDYIRLQRSLAVLMGQRELKSGKRGTK